MIFSLFKSLLHFCYPPICLHCTHPLTKRHSTLCKLCQEDLALLDYKNRCGFCFQMKESQNCQHCRGQARFCDYKASAFELSPPIQSLLSSLSHTTPYLASGLASYLLIQLEALGWPTPDYITFVPPYSKWARPQASQLLAQELGKLLHIPVLALLDKQLLHMKQTNLPTCERTQLPLHTFSLASHKSTLEGANILVIDDFMKSGRTLECCAYALLNGNPKRIYGLCVAIDTS